MPARDCAYCAPDEPCALHVGAQGDDRAEWEGDAGVSEPTRALRRAVGDALRSGAPELVNEPAAPSDAEVVSDGGFAAASSLLSGIFRGETYNEAIDRVRRERGLS